MPYTAYKLTDMARAHLLSVFTPENPNVICHHITEKFGVAADHPAPAPAKVVVVGIAFDNSLECLVVEVNGQRHRPDGKSYHITLSLDRSKGRKPVESNEVIACFGWKALEQPIDLGEMPGVTLN